MTKKPLPKFIQPLRFAERKTLITGKLPLTEFTRLAALLTHQQGEAAITLDCDRDEQRIPYIKGTIQACLPLRCQRCLTTVEYTLELAISLWPVLTEAAGNKLPDCYEPLLLSEDQVLLSMLIEDELLLGLPFAPKHEQSDCHNQSPP